MGTIISDIKYAITLFIFMSLVKYSIAILVEEKERLLKEIEQDLAALGSKG